MHITTIRNSSNVMVHGVYIKSMWAIFGGFALFLIMKILGLFSAELLLYFNIINTDFFYTTTFTLIKYSYPILTYLLCVPLIMLGLRRSLLILNPCFAMSRISATKFSLKSLVIFFIMWLMLLTVFIPIAISFKLSSYFLSIANNNTVLFLLSLYSFIMGLILLIPYLCLILTNILTPFILIKYQSKNIFTIIKISFCALKENYLKIIRLLLVWLIPCLTIVAIPFILPRIIAQLSVFTDDITIPYNKR